MNTKNALNTKLMIVREIPRNFEIPYGSVKLRTIFFLLSYLGFIWTERSLLNSLGFILSPHQKLLLSDIENVIERGKLAYKTFQSHFNAM